MIKINVIARSRIRLFVRVFSFKSCLILKISLIDVSRCVRSFCDDYPVYYL